jgi:polyribonucleotide nucleotidyltransferase
MAMEETLTLDFGGRPYSIQTGKVAKQAAGAVWVQYGETVVLVTVVAAKMPPPDDRDFFPLTVDYREKTYAAGKIPGGFFKREGRPTEKEILSSRLTDRPLRPLFPKGFRNEVQIQAIVLSSDQQNDSDILSLTGASAAVMLSDVPFNGPVSGVRIGRVDGQFVINPTFAQLDESDMDIVVAATTESIIMVEGGAREVPEAAIVAAFQFAWPELQRLNQLQIDLASRCGKPKRIMPVKEVDQNLIDSIDREFGTRIEEALRLADKEEREAAIGAIGLEAIEKFAPEGSQPGTDRAIKAQIEAIEKRTLRGNILDRGVRADGRGLKDIRSITCEVGVLPRTHGSALFTRGQTQALVVTTLGTSTDEQRVEELEGPSWKSYMLHYNFPPFSVGEVRPLRGPGRREIGHGALAERAIQPVIPADDVFPYTIRIVSDILESNGSSSMATVCGGTLALMDAGVPIKAPVAGIAMGLVKEGDRVATLTDILGVEDHLGDMDFKVTGTRDGVTALQMDMKIGGIDLETIDRALAEAREARMVVLDAMNAAIAVPRSDLSAYAPRIIVLQIDPEKIREVIGPGGKTIRKITEETGTEINIEDNGEVRIASYNAAAGMRAVEIIRGLVEDPEVGQIYRGKVKRIAGFGAFVEIAPGKDGLVHISELDHHRVAQVEDVVQEGDIVTVKVIGVDKDGKIRLSRKQVLPAADKAEAKSGGR